MNKRLRSIVLIAIFVANAILNLIVFLTVPNARFDSAVFWLAWSFACPVCLILSVGFHLYASKRGNDALIAAPISYYLAVVAEFLYLGVGVLFMYLPIKAVTFPIIAEAVITGGFIIAAMFFLYGGEHMMSQEKIVKEKVLFIRLLASDVEGAASIAKSEELRAALLSFGEDIRFSDPMSHASLEAVESQISATVDEISAKITLGKEDEAMELVLIAKRQLERRNSRCLALK